MKNLFKIFLLALSLSFFFTACNNSAQSGQEGTENAETTQADSQTDLGHEGTAVSYADDWGAFKSALVNKNVDGINSFIASDVVDAQGLIDMCSQEVLDKMAETSYDQLPEVDFNGEMTKEFSYSETSYDEDGNEMGMGLFFYFKETAEGLRLVNFLAAG